MKEKFSTCISFDKNINGRIGGSPPIIIENLIPENYLFYATLVHPKNENHMLSILIHESFDTLVDNNIYPCIEVKVIEHEYANQGSVKNRQIKDISINSISEYKNKIEDNKFFLVKFGGNPRFIQNNDFFYKKLASEGYSYLLQIDEEGYSDDLLIENYPFNYGALFLYEHKETKKVIAGFWQYS